MHELVVVHLERDHLPRHLGRDVHDVAVRVGVVRIDLAASRQVVVDAPRRQQQAQDHGGRDDDWPPLLPATPRKLFLVVLDLVVLLAFRNSLAIPLVFLRLLPFDHVAACTTWFVFAIALVGSAATLVTRLATGISHLPPTAPATRVIAI